MKKNCHARQFFMRECNVYEKQPAIMYNFRHLMQLSRVQKSHVVRVILYDVLSAMTPSSKNEINEAVSFISLSAFFRTFIKDTLFFNTKNGVT